MIEIKNGLLNSDQFLNAFSKLITSTELEVYTTYLLVGLRKQVAEIVKTYTEIRQKYINELCEKDEKGNPVTMEVENNKNKMYSFKGPNASVFNQKINELNEICVEINCNPIIINFLEIPKGLLNSLDMEILEDSKLFIFKKEK